MFESGVKRYIHAHATVHVHFPVDFRDNAFVACSYCGYYSPSSRLCRLTGILSEFPDKYIGGNCPLDFEEEDPNG